MLGGYWGCSQVEVHQENEQNCQTVQGGDRERRPRILGGASQTVHAWKEVAQGRGSLAAE